MRRGLAAAVVVLGLAGCGGSDPLPVADKAAAEKAPPAELPGGGQFVFHDPKRRIVAFYGKPDVALGLDPEWHGTGDEVPGQVIGSVDAADVVATGAWLDQLTAQAKLPQKLLLVHQFTEGMITRRELLRPFAHVAVVLNVD